MFMWKYIYYILLRILKDNQLIINRQTFTRAFAQIEEVHKGNYFKNSKSVIKSICLTVIVIPFK